MAYTALAWARGSFSISRHPSWVLMPASIEQAHLAWQDLEYQEALEGMDDDQIRLPNHGAGNFIANLYATTV